MAQDEQNVFVGVSVRNKALTPQQVENIVARAQKELQARRLLFLIADELELVNLRIFGSGTAGTLERQVEERCGEIEAIIRQGTSSVHVDRMHIVIDRWRCILNAEYWASYVRVFSRFVERPQFRHDIETVARRYVERRGETASPDEIHYLSTYLLAEIPTLLDGVRYEQRRYRTMIYPVRETEAIDKITERLAQAYYGATPIITKMCKIVRMEA